MSGPAIRGNEGTQYVDPEKSLGMERANTANPTSEVGRVQTPDLGAYFEDVVEKGVKGHANVYGSKASRPAIPLPVLGAPHEQASYSLATTSSGISYSSSLQYDVIYSEQLQRMLKESKLPEDIKNQVGFLLANPKSADLFDEHIRKTAAAFRKQAIEEVLAGDRYLSPEWQPTPPADDQFTRAYISIVQQFLPEDPKEAAKLEFAYYHPEMVSPEMREKADALHVQVTQALAEQHIEVPPTYKPDSRFIDDEISTNYDMQFEDLLKEWGENKDPKVVQALLTLHYHPDADIQNVDQYRSILQDLERTAHEETRDNFMDQYGLEEENVPPDWPQTDTNSYDAMIESAYRARNTMNLEALINKPPFPLTDAEKALLRKAFEDPNAPDIPEKIKALAVQVMSKSLEEIRVEYQLKTWEPSETSPALWQGSTEALNGLQNLNDMKDILAEYATRFPPNSPERVIFQNYLKAVGEAIDKLQQLLYAQQSQDAKGAKVVSDARCEAAKDKAAEWKKAYDDQVEQQRQIEEQQKKAGKLGSIMKVLGPIMIAVAIVATIVTLGTMGPLAIALTVALLAFTITSQVGGPNLIQGAMNGFVTMLHDIGIPEGKWGDLVMKIVMIAIVFVLTKNVGTGMASAAGTAAAATNIATTMLTSSDITQSFLVNCGVKPEVAAIAAACVNAVISIGASFKTAYGNATNKTMLLAQMRNDIGVINRQLAAAPSTMQYISLQIQKGAKIVAIEALERGDQYLHMAEQTVQTSMVGLQVTKGYFDYQVNMMQGVLAKTKGDADARQAIIDNMLSTLKSLIQMMNNLMQGEVEFNAELGKYQQRKFVVARSQPFVV